jgi:hypothetical protein
MIIMTQSQKTPSLRVSLTKLKSLKIPPWAHLVKNNNIGNVLTVVFSPSGAVVNCTFGEIIFILTNLGTLDTDSQLIEGKMTSSFINN